MATMRSATIRVFGTYRPVRQHPLAQSLLRHDTVSCLHRKKTMSKSLLQDVVDILGNTLRRAIKSRTEGHLDIAYPLDGAKEGQSGDWIFKASHKKLIL